mmetsp:Transcript_3961/g.11278  ORF Transcript_3961/g.11278 Transcript_3961/m.11278 type:complete len:244 (+) Transcript_3961:1686-2417(+)
MMLLTSPSSSSGAPPEAMNCAMAAHPSGPIWLSFRHRRCRALALSTRMVEMPCDVISPPSLIPARVVLVRTMENRVRMLWSFITEGNSTAAPRAPPSAPPSSRRKHSPRTDPRHFPALSVAPALLARSQNIWIACCHQPRPMICLSGLAGHTSSRSSCMKPSLLAHSCRHCSAQRNSWKVRWEKRNVSSPASLNHVRIGSRPFLTRSSMWYHCSMPNWPPRPLVSIAAWMTFLLKSRTPLPPS